MKLNGTLENIDDNSEIQEEMAAEGGEATPGFCLPTAELQLQRKHSHTPKNAPKKTLEQFSKESFDIFEVPIADEK